MKKSMIALAIAAASATASAELSSTVAVVSDYTFNGVSQTDSGPALQASLDYGHESGAYVGTWASNVDFGENEDTNLEWDFYVGHYAALTSAANVDYGIAYYTYHGDDDFSEDYAYGEVYSKFDVSSDMGTSELNLWYAWDYFGTEAGHYIVQVAHTLEVAENHNVRVSVDQSTTTDDEKWQWFGEDSYIHYKAAYQTSLEGFDIEVAYENTNIDEDLTDNADGRVVAGISRTFAF